MIRLFDYILHELQTRSDKKKYFLQCIVYDYISILNIHENTSLYLYNNSQENFLIKLLDYIYLKKIYPANGINLCILPECL